MPKKVADLSTLTQKQLDKCLRRFAKALLKVRT